ncbi:TIGR03089 family protein [Nocardioides sp. GY 10113]|uniref:TIGR03089 family protein n=1 Tax=Nocardioides sp. GY 10113 TaxID=2569761 RepID=UPI0010A88EB7|nr:TIGR03089 family protein [Nocardioides sp. GY 10113]TIC87905.1 TIGR03089 family protein [Nocardioides sp. GY 10113]
MSTGTPTTFAQVLAARLRHEPGRPLVTFYDHATDERVELSVTTYANWVAKCASLLVDELGLERGDLLRIDLPTHWLSTVFLGAAWTAGLVVSDAEDPAAVVCGPETLERWAPEADERVVLACALLPLGVRFRDGVPPGVHDVGVEVWSQPDAFIPWDPPGGEDPATDLAGTVTTHEQMWRAAAAGDLLPSGGRLLTVANPASPPGVATFVEPLANGGSMVLIARTEQSRLEATYVAERATARFPV